MAKAPQLDTKTRDNITNWVFIRMAKQMGVFREFRPEILGQWNRSVRGLNIDFPKGRHVYQNEISFITHSGDRGYWDTFLLCMVYSEYIVHRLGYRDRIQDFLNSIQQYIYRDESDKMKKFRDTYEAFKRGNDMQRLLDTIKKNGLEYYTNLYY